MGLMAGMAWPRGTILMQFIAIAAGIPWQNEPHHAGGLPHEDGYAMRHSWSHFRLLYFFILLWFPLGVWFVVSGCCWKFEKLSPEEASDKVFNKGAVERRARAHLRSRQVAMYERD